MTNIIDLNTKSALDQASPSVAVESQTYNELKMNNIVCLRFREVDIIGMTDKDIGYDLVAFATVSIKDPFVVTWCDGEVSLTPYFAYASSVVATFNTTHIEAYIAHDKLPNALILQYASRVHTQEHEKTNDLQTEVL